MQSSSLPKILAGRTVEGPISARITIDGRPYINFFGAGYLALSGLPEIRAAVMGAVKAGVPFSRQLPATHGAANPQFDAVELAGAKAYGTEASIYFATGYLVGAVALSSLGEPIDLILVDESAHYSLVDAAKLIGKPTVTFAHCDPESVKAALKKRVRPGERPVLLTDGAFATTGRVPPIAEYAAVLSAYEGRIVVDESHTFGVVGKNGRGAAEYCGVDDIAVIGATLSKALCAQGAIVGCSRSTAARLRAIPPIGAASAGSPLSAVAATASLSYVTKHPELRSGLRETANYLRRRLNSLGLKTADTPAPIVSFENGTRYDMQALQRYAFEQGIYIHYSTYVGAGPEGTIRCAIFRDHTEADMDALIEMVQRI